MNEHDKRRLTRLAFDTARRIPPTERTRAKTRSAFITPDQRQPCAHGENPCNAQAEQGNSSVFAYYRFHQSLDNCPTMEEVIHRVNSC